MSTDNTHDKPVQVLFHAMPRFALGHCYITPGARDALETSGDSPLYYLGRHQSGDWGMVGEEDAQENEWSLEPEHQCRIMSIYETALEVRIWVITEWDRSATTILLPQEY